MKILCGCGVGWCAATKAFTITMCDDEIKTQSIFSQRIIWRVCDSVFASCVAPNSHSTRTYMLRILTCPKCVESRSDRTASMQEILDCMSRFVKP